MTSADAPGPDPAAPPAPPVLEPRRLDPALVPVLARLADAGCEDAADPLFAGMRMAQLASQMNPAFEPFELQIVTLAFAYTLRCEELPDAGAELTPLTGPSIPVALRETTDDLRAAWLALASAVTHPVTRARLHDITFTLRRIGSLRIGAFGGEQPVAPAPFLVVTGIPQHQERQLVQRQGVDLVRLKSPCAIHTGILPGNINVVRDDSPS
jgi:hypothetical protein